jgi:Putative peptidoglycan binding domain
VPSARNHSRRAGKRGESAIGSLAARTWAHVAERPVDSFAILGAAAATFAIVVNAAFLQSGSHPTPYFANPVPDPPMLQIPRRPADMMPTHSVPAPRPQPAPPAPAPPQAARHNDPIAELIGPSPRIAAVQRVLTQYGYGQIRPTGMLDGPTGEAIEKFERERKLPVDGRVSDRLVGELVAMVGHPIE